MIRFENLLKTTRAYTAILSDKTQANLGHCYMIITEDELACVGLCELASRIILCENNDCGECLNCQKVQQNSHSAIFIPQDIKADSIRKVIEQAYIIANEGATKLIVIDNFSEIKPAQQNLLLKVLEEPPQNVVFILGVTQVSMVLDTIKSRSKKLVVDKLDAQKIQQELLVEGYSFSQVNKAVECSFGNLTKAISLVEDKEFIRNYDLWISILKDMQTSKQIVSMLDRISTKDESMLKYCDIIEIILKALLDIRINGNKSFEELAYISDIYNEAMIVNIMDLVIYCRKKLKSNCRPEAIADSLLMGILEVKYKCR